MGQDRRSALNHQISEEAAEWLVEFRTSDIDAAGRRDFDAWVRASPEHLRAFIEMAALWTESGAIDPQRRLDVDAIIARAKRGQNIVGLTSTVALGKSADSGSHSSEEAPPKVGTPVALRSRPANRQARSAAWRAIAASLLVAVLGTALFLRSSLFGPPTYATGVGEQRSIRLPDGSRVVLDSRTRLRVDFIPTVRQVELLQGQALFYVVKSPQRPFVVRAGGAVIRDVGTQFDVNRRLDGTIVTVVEGKVAVLPQSVSTRPGNFEQAPWVRQPPAVAQNIDIERRQFGRPIFLSAGEQVSVPTRDLFLSPIRVNVGAVTAWTHGQVVLDAATLGQVAEAFNRYSSRRLVTEDHGTTPLRLSGVFATDPDFLIRYLRERSDITVTETDSEISIVRNSSK